MNKYIVAGVILVIGIGLGYTIHTLQTPRNSEIVDYVSLTTPPELASGYPEMNTVATATGVYIPPDPVVSDVSPDSVIVGDMLRELFTREGWRANVPIGTPSQSILLFTGVLPEEKGDFTALDAQIDIRSMCEDKPAEDMEFGDVYVPTGEVSTTRISKPYPIRRTTYTIYQKNIHYAIALSGTDTLCVSVRGYPIFFPGFESSLLQVLNEYASSTSR